MDGLYKRSGKMQQKCISGFLLTTSASWVLDTVLSPTFSSLIAAYTDTIQFEQTTVKEEISTVKFGDGRVEIQACHSNHSDTCLVEGKMTIGIMNENSSLEMCQTSQEVNLEFISIETEEPNLSTLDNGSSAKHVSCKTSNDINKRDINLNSKQCYVCSKQFTRPSDLKRHIRYHEGEKPFVCTYCGKEFSRKSTLATHFRIHTGERRYKCDHCDYKCIQKGTLTLHMRSHTGDKPFECDQCEYSSKQKYGVTVHMRTHTGEKLFSCTYCDSAFSTSSNLKKHLRVHEGVKPYMCSTCNASFTQNHHLQKHSLTHSGEKPFTCGECGKSFSQKSHLTLHLRIHTGEKPYKCSTCDKLFSSPNGHNYHVKRCPSQLRVDSRCADNVTKNIST